MWAGIAFAISVLFVALLIPNGQAAAAACATPSTNYGTVSGLSVTADTTGTYRIWTRMAAANTSENTYLLEVDGATCFTVGGSSVPTYASGAANRFTGGTSNWVNKTSADATISMALSAGAHSIKLIGNGNGVVVDRVIITASTTCSPSGTGNNCADASAPTLTSIASSSVTHQAATITWSSNEAASTQVQYGTTTSYGTSTTLNTSLVLPHSVGITGLSAGTLYHYRVLSTDEAGNTTVSTDRTFTTASIPTYKAGDVNQDGVVGILDVSLQIAKWNQTGTGLGRSDINGDNVVNILDLSLLIAQYGL